MKNRTVRIIIILVSLLFMNIEAAHAGLIHKFRLYIAHEFPDWQLIFFCTGLSAAAFLVYVIAAPVSIGRGRRIWFTDDDIDTVKKFSDRRKAVTKISVILSKQAASLH
jgi:hypothetical protein